MDESEKKSKRGLRKGVDVKFPENVGIEFDLTFNECGRVSLSRASLKELIENAAHTEKTFIIRYLAFLLAGSV